MMLTELSLTKLKKIKRAIEDFFYKVRFNVAFYNASRSDDYRNFAARVEEALERQILVYAKVERVRDVQEFGKAVKELEDDRLLEGVKKFWVPLLDIIEKDDIDSFYRAMGIRGGQTALDRLGIDKKFVLENKAILRELLKRRKFLVETVDKSTQSWVARTIEEGVNKNLNTEQIARVLRSQARGVADARTTKIAETESIWTMSFVELTTYQRNRVLEKRWITALDERVCEICNGNENAGWIGIRENFPSGDQHPVAHPLCRCLLEVRVPKEVKRKWLGE